MALFHQIKKEFGLLSDPKKAEFLKKFFRAGKGDYGEGDVLLGITVPKIRSLAKKYSLQVSFDIIQQFLHSSFHEERFLALVFLMEKLKRSKDPESSKAIFDFYLEPNNLKWINNWDLVDISCRSIIGNYLIDNPSQINILYEFAKSDNLWRKRIAIVATASFISRDEFEHTIKIAEILLYDKHDLIHKAVGWMLREVGKRDMKKLINFLDKYSTQMSRTTLRYSIEKFTAEDRLFYLKKPRQ